MSLREADYKVVYFFSTTSNWIEHIADRTKCLPPQRAVLTSTIPSHLALHLALPRDRTSRLGTSVRQRPNESAMRNFTIG